MADVGGDRSPAKETCRDISCRDAISPLCQAECTLTPPLEHPLPILSLMPPLHTPPTHFEMASYVSKAPSLETRASWLTTSIPYPTIPFPATLPSL